jgi:hypothetical protein
MGGTAADLKKIGRPQNEGVPPVLGHRVVNVKRKRLSPLISPQIGKKCCQPAESSAKVPRVATAGFRFRLKLMERDFSGCASIKMGSNTPAYWVTPRGNPRVTANMLLAQSSESFQHPRFE